MGRHQRVERLGASSCRLILGRQIARTRGQPSGSLQRWPTAPRRRRAGRPVLGQDFAQNGLEPRPQSAKLLAGDFPVLNLTWHRQAFPHGGGIATGRVEQKVRLMPRSGEAVRAASMRSITRAASTPGRCESQRLRGYQLPKLLASRLQQGMQVLPDDVRNQLVFAACWKGRRASTASGSTPSSLRAAIATWRRTSGPDSAPSRRLAAAATISVVPDFPPARTAQARKPGSSLPQQVPGETSHERPAADERHSACIRVLRWPTSSDTSLF